MAELSALEENIATIIVHAVRWHTAMHQDRAREIAEMAIVDMKTEGVRFYSIGREAPTFGTTTPHDGGDKPT